MSFLSPENIIKPKIFCFQRVQKEISGMKWVKGRFVRIILASYNISDSSG